MKKTLFGYFFSQLKFYFTYEHSETVAERLCTSSFIQIERLRLVDDHCCHNLIIVRVTENIVKFEWDQRDYWLPPPLIAADQINDVFMGPPT